MRFKRQTDEQTNKQTDRQTEGRRRRLKPAPLYLVRRGLTL